MKSFIQWAVVGLIGLIGFIALAGALAGCQAPNPNPAAVVAPTGTDIDQAGAYVGSAESAVQAAIPHADAAGQADLGLATSAHKQATGSLAKAKADLVVVQTTLASEEKLNDRLDAQVNALLDSWGHKLQVWVTWAFWIIVALAAVHLIAGLVQIIFPQWGIIPGIVANVVNPLGWLTWFVAHSSMASIAATNAKTAAQAAVTKVIPS